MIFTSKRPSENTVSDGLQHFIQLRKMVRQRRVIVQSLQRGGNAVRTAFFHGNCAGDGIGQSLRVCAIEEKARFGFHHFATGHVVGQYDARAAQHRFNAHQAEGFVQRGHDGVIGGAV